jgi:predicted DsbA family dithiol-disulfide isomerase
VIAILALAYPLIKGLADNADTKDVKSSTTPGEYTLAENMANTHEPGKVKMLVFFDFYCPHCYSFDTGSLAQLESKYGSQLEAIPIGFPIFGTKAVNALSAYELAKDLGKGEEMKLAVFRAHHDQKRDISDTSVLAEIAGEVGLDSGGFKNSLDKGEKDEVVQRNIELAKSYDLKQTPTVVLDGQYVVTDISQENLNNLISNLLEM